jgi:hypothetical protein
MSAIFDFACQVARAQGMAMYDTSLQRMNQMSYDNWKLGRNEDDPEAADERRILREARLQEAEERADDSGEDEK